MRTRVVGLGNPRRGDDAAGAEAARRLRALLPEAVEVRMHAGEPIDLVEGWPDLDLLVLIDTSRPEGAPGRVRRYELGVDGPRPRGLGTSTHAFDPLTTVALAGAMGMLPARLVLYAVEGVRFGIDEPLSEAVVAGVSELVGRLHDELTALEWSPAHA